MSAQLEARIKALEDAKQLEDARKKNASTLDYLIEFKQDDRYFAIQDGGLKQVRRDLFLKGIGTVVENTNVLKFNNNVGANFHIGSNNQPLEGVMQIDLSNAVPNGIEEFVYKSNSNPPSNPNFQFINGSQPIDIIYARDTTPITTNDSHTILMKYEIDRIKIIISKDGELIQQGNNTSGGNTGGNTNPTPPSAPNLSQTEEQFTTGVSPNVPNITQTEEQFTIGSAPSAPILTQTEENY